MLVGQIPEGERDEKDPASIHATAGLALSVGGELSDS